MLTEIAQIELWRKPPLGLKSDAFSKNHILQKLKSITDEEIKNLLDSHQAYIAQRNNVCEMDICHDQQKKGVD